MITSNQSHFERKQSRARAFSKKMQGFTQNTTESQGLVKYEMTNIKDMEEDE